MNVIRQRRDFSTIILRLLADCLLGLLMAALIGCSGLPGELKTTPESTATPLPASAKEDGFKVQAADACLVAEDAVIQTSRQAGNMLAWQPGEDSLAFIGPIGRSWGWSVGDALVAPIVSGEPVNTHDIYVAGDLTWSPDGIWLAFIALRPADSQYTIEVWKPGDGSLIDLFAMGATTDAYASQKAIVQWRDGNRLQVSESCGVDCIRITEISIIGGEQRIIQEIRLAEDHSLDVDLNQPKGITIFTGWLNANVSPDEMSVFFSDDKANGWIANIEESNKYILDLQGSSPLESKWSEDSRYLAVRTDQRVLVFQMDCREKSQVRRLSQP